MDEQIKKRAMEILDRLTLKEKIGQLNQDTGNTDNIDVLKEKIRRGEVGSLILATSATAGNDEQSKPLLEAINELQRVAVEESPSGIPIILGRDVIHGHETVLPVPLALSAGFNPQTIYEAYRCVAKEAANDGIHWAFSPMIDISRDPRWGRCVEGIGEDPYLGERVAEAVIKGFQGDDYTAWDSIAACAKHYVGYGAVEGGRDYGKAEISDYTLRNYYLKPFRAAVKNGLATVMSSFNEISGTSPTSSRYLLYDVLKKEFGLEGFVVSDWNSVGKLVYQGLAEDRKRAAELAVNAGLDMDMAGQSYLDYLEELVKEGKVSEETIDEAVLRILYIKLSFGLFEHPYTQKHPVDYEEHARKAKACSDEGMVLLKNKNNILPLSPTESDIYLAGPMMYEKRTLFGTWTLDGDLSRVVTIADAIKSAGANVTVSSSPYLWDECITDVRKHDVVVLALGESHLVTGEANSLSRIELPPEQLELVKKIHRLGKPIIGVMCFGRPIALGDAQEYFDAILYSWHSGTYTAQSIADILYGKVNPSGKLPMTLPRCTGQIPIYYNYPGTCGEVETYYADKDNNAHYYHDDYTTPMYPFGYGLSYTQFEYSDIVCDRDEIPLSEIEAGAVFKISATVKNVGKYDGKEASQCYIRDEVGSMSRPRKELKGISKNMLKVGEEKRLTFELGFEELAFYNANKEFKPERGDFTIFIGGDCYADMSVGIKIV
mgnify:FL=1